MVKNKTKRKPNTRGAMHDLVQQVRSAVPFDMSVADICVDDCYGCPKKLMEYLDMELENWEARSLPLGYKDWKTAMSQTLAI
jgi:hypothetical protein